MMSIGVKPSPLSVAEKTSGTQTAFIPKAGSLVSSPGTRGKGASPVTTRTSPIRNSLLAITAPCILI